MTENKSKDCILSYYDQQCFLACYLLLTNILSVCCVLKELDVSKMKVAELREQLKQRGLDVKGNKAALIERLNESLNAEALEGDEEEDGVETGRSKTGCELT